MRIKIAARVVTVLVPEAGRGVPVLRPGPGYNCTILKGGMFKGRARSWGTLRIPREDWGSLREH